VRLDRQTVARRRFDDGHVSNPRQRHVQRPRNRRRRHREHVDFLAHLLDAFLVRHAEALLFVDDEQAKISKGHILGEQAVCADDDVQLAGREIGENLLLFGLRPEAADHFRAHREAGESSLDGPQVLKGQHGRRREKRDLLAVHDDLERRAHRDFGLAVTDVATEQAVHRGR
jgi:hypothetical protein